MVGSFIAFHKKNLTTKMLKPNIAYVRKILIEESVLLDCVLRGEYGAGLELNILIEEYT